MTVCIEALCAEGKAIVVAADRMVTAAGLALEFEHDRSKIVTLPGNCVAATAGDALLAAELVRDVESALKHHPGADVDVVASLLVNAYRSGRDRRLEEQLRQLGYTWDLFKTEGLKQLGPQMHANVLQNMQQFNAGVELLVAGFTGAGGNGRIGYLQHPGALRWFDPLGFTASGSGGMQAQMSLISARYSVKLPIAEAVFHVYKAKRNAEASPGVGKETDMLVLAPDGKNRTISRKCYDELTNLFERATTTVSLDITKLKESLDASL